jgi:4-amino-4-deoxy-L-arabinose transferase-like glycosyltransferase
MRAALLLSVMCVICGLAALFGIPAVYVAAKPLFGVVGLAASLVFAVIPPLVVLGWRKYSRK